MTMLTTRRDPRSSRSTATRVLSLALSLALLGGDVFAQRQRGSVKTTRSTSGDTATRTRTAQGAGGQTATGTKNVSKDGDTITVDRQVQSSTGGSAQSQKQYEVDDGQVQSVSREASATDRYGRTAQYEGKAEREGYGWEFEGEGKNRNGQNVEVDGYGARGYYGSGVVADVEGGRYGNRTVVAGKPYGGPTYVRTLPYGARPQTYWGRPYYAHGGVYYRPYTVHGVVVYGYIPPPYYVYYPQPPVGAIIVTVAAVTLLYADGAYYKKTTTSGTTQYQVVPAPAGASIPGTSLPADRASVSAGGQTYFLYGNTFYRRVVTSGQESFVAVTRPAGVVMVKALPPDFDALPVGSLTYFKAGDRFYLSFLDPAGEELYVVVNPPASATASSAPAVAAAPGGAKPAAPQAAAPPPATAPPARLDLTVPAGTVVPVVMSADVSSASAKVGQRFQAHLQRDLVVNGRLVAAKGTRVYGRVTEAKAGTGTGGAPVLAMELTDIQVGEYVFSLGTNTVRLTADGKNPTKKIVGGALLGAGIGAAIDGGTGAAVGAAAGAVAGTAVAAGSSGNQVNAGAGAALEFQIARPLTVTVLVPASATAH